MIRDLANWSTKWEKESSRDGCIRIYSKKYKKISPFLLKINYLNILKQINMREQFLCWNCLSKMKLN